MQNKFCGGGDSILYFENPLNYPWIQYDIKMFIIIKFAIKINIYINLDIGWRLTISIGFEKYIPQNYIIWLNHKVRIFHTAILFILIYPNIQLRYTI